MILWLAATVLLGITLWHLIVADDPEPIFGKYRQPGPRFWIKYLFMRAALWFKKRRSKRMAGNKNDGPGCHLLEKERMLPLGKHPLAFDAVFFMGCSMEGIYLIIGSERRHHNIVNSPVYILIPKLGLLKHRKLPDTCLFGASQDAFGAEGIKIEPLEPLKSWRVEFNGVMRLQGNPSREVKVTLQSTWTASSSPFDYDTDLHHHSVAKTLAVEPWSRDFFRRLESAHQSHYEQMGHLRGNVQVEDMTFPLDLMSIRNHTSGPVRDFDLLHRDAFFMMFLEDGTRISVLVVNQPCSVSTMESGYVCLPSGEMHSMRWSDFKLYQHGECGNPPMDTAFSFEAGGKIYRVKARGEEVAVHYVGWEWEAKICEMFSSYEVNGIRGRGLAEFVYHNKTGRAAAAATGDPEWFDRVIREAYANPSPYSLRLRNP